MSLDGARIKANASNHSALSYGCAQKREAQIKAEISALKRRAEAAEDLPDELSLPAELQRREDRLDAIRHEARAAERDAPAQAGPTDGNPINLTDPEPRILPILKSGRLLGSALF